VGVGSSLQSHRCWLAADVYRAAVSTRLRLDCRRDGSSHQKENTLSAEQEVREASKRFYSGLNAMINGNNAPMADAWAHDATVSSMHPIGGRELGWEQVRASFAGVGSMATAGHVELADQHIQAAGDMACEVGIERGQATLAGEQINIEHRVTNVYRRDGGTWKIVHHHTDISPSMVDLLARLQKRS
jgi:ketosteroid isomerase-like protein